MKFLSIAAFCVTLLALSLGQGTHASAAAGYTLFGDASLVSPGHDSQTAAQLRSTAGGAVFGGVSFAAPTGMTLNDLKNLSTDYKFTASSCGGGAPRFQINIDGTNIFVYLGPYPNYNVCAMNIWTPSGELLMPAAFVDTSKLSGGAFYDTWSAALTKYGTHAVTGIQLVTDSSWFFGGATQTVLVDNVRINARTETFEANNGRGDKGDKQHGQHGEHGKHGDHHGNGNHDGNHDGDHDDGDHDDGDHDGDDQDDD